MRPGQPRPSARARRRADRPAAPSGRPSSPLRLARSRVKTARIPPLWTRLRAASFQTGRALAPGSRSTQGVAPSRIPKTGARPGWTVGPRRCYMSEPHRMRDGEAQGRALCEIPASARPASAFGCFGTSSVDWRKLATNTHSPMVELGATLQLARRARFVRITCVRSGTCRLRIGLR